MDVTLACTGNLERDGARLQWLLPKLHKFYSGVALSLPPGTPQACLELLDSGFVTVTVNQDWSRGRHAALEKALELSAPFIHLADLDRVLYWLAAYPDELQKILHTVPETDCLILGRTEKAFQTHPQALRQTEKLINEVFSYVLEQTVDLGGGSRGFSRRAARFLLANSTVKSSWSTDSEWPVLLFQEGFPVRYCAVDGLAWQGDAAVYDADVRHWVFRTDIAHDIVHAGLSVMPHLQRSLE